MLCLLNNKQSTICRESLEWFLCAMYTGTPPELTLQTAMEVLLEFAHKFVLIPIQETCTDYIINHLDDVDIPTLCHLAFVLSDGGIWKYIFEHYYNILNYLNVGDCMYSIICPELMGMITSRMLYDNISISVIMSVLTRWIHDGYMIDI